MESDKKNYEDTSVILDPVQLKRIESIHRGFLYQHLYAVGCIFKLTSVTSGSVSVELDEDIEVVTDNEIFFIQVKTRTNSLVKSDISSALKRFSDLKKNYTEKKSTKTVRFFVVTNVEPGPVLSSEMLKESWPQDVFICSPKNPPKSFKLLPPVWNSLNEGVKWCINTANDIPFSILNPETLVWKLAARVQFASTGEDAERKNHSFDRKNLANIFEQLVVQLQEFPDITEEYKPQSNGDNIIQDERISLVVGFSGAGKTTWASWYVLHTTCSPIYFNVGDLPGETIAGSLAREIAARFLSSADIATLPASSAFEMLTAINSTVDTRKSPLIVIDNVHRIDIEEVRQITMACSNFKFILLAQPWDNEKRLEVLLDISSKRLNGWDIDTIASVFYDEGISISPMLAERWKIITSGMPLYIKNVVSVCSLQYEKDAETFADEVEKGEHFEILAQEAIIGHVIESFSTNELFITLALSFSMVPLSRYEIRDYFKALPQHVGNYHKVLRDLQKRGIIQVYTNGNMLLHDAIRSPISSYADNFPSHELLDMQEKLRNILYESILKSHDLARFSCWIRLLVPTGKINTLVDVASTELFHEIGEASDLKAILIQIAQNKNLSSDSRFWILDTFIFWEFQDNRTLCEIESYINDMTVLVESEDFGHREQIIFNMKRILYAGLNNNRASVDEYYQLAQKHNDAEPDLSRILRYNYTQALYNCKDYEDSIYYLNLLIEEYFDALGLNPNDIEYANPKDIIPLLKKDFEELQDDLKHFADCLNLYAMCRRELNLNPGFNALHAMKFYSMSKSYHSAMKAAQDVADDCLVRNDAKMAREILEEYAIPIWEEFNFLQDTVDLKGQYAVVLAQCDDHEKATEVISKLLPFRSSLSTDEQEALDKQQYTISNLKEVSDYYKLPISEIRKLMK